MTETLVIPCYGVHWAPSGLAFLQQGRGGTNAFGYRERSPFVVKLPSRKRHCNHQIPLATPVPNDYHWDYFLRVSTDPVVRTMLPIPKIEPGGAYIEDNDGSLTLHLIALSRMSSPIYSAVVPMWQVTRQGMMDELVQTNVQPFVITGCEPKHSSLIQELAAASLYNPRMLVFVGRSDVVLSQNIRRIKPTILKQLPIEEFSGLPWEAIGATVCRKYMRDEFNPKDGSYDFSAKAIPTGRPDR